ncbi:unnamed protein product [Bursaphelenchus xylophilus]|uniref:(pine wood nematode) hypothetical protein n=1 Tax=Bursaphelenchus xylophilus TaxID=6326 RepID=A0A1I7S165_BURXY|nr:unnamed protein product [Bursaphelenchus xylophilus]CAG9080034.1 unnamed protein product [Bursaphelenchus xylophilus]
MRVALVVMLCAGLVSPLNRFFRYNRFASLDETIDRRAESHSVSDEQPEESNEETGGDAYNKYHALKSDLEPMIHTTAPPFRHVAYEIGIIITTKTPAPARLHDNGVVMKSVSKKDVSQFVPFEWE